MASGKFMKGGSGAVWLGFVLALLLVIKGLAAGSVLEPTSIDPNPPGAASSRTNPMVESKALYYAGKRGSLNNAESHNKEQLASSQCGDR
jgi:hypothetical protein